MSYVVVTFLMLALGLTMALAGGRQLALCLPGYGLLAIAAVLSWCPLRKRPIPRGAGECLVTTALFFAYIAGRAFFSPEEYLARRDLYLAMGAFAAYLLTALCIPSARARMWLVGGMLLLALANCGIGAIQHFKGQNFMIFDFLPRPDYATRASGFFGYPNHLATYLSMSFLLGLAVTFWSRWPIWAKLLMGYVSLLCLLGLLLTGSRGGYIATAFGALVFGLLSLVLVGKLVSGRVVIVVIFGCFALGGIGWGIKQLKSRSFLIESRTTETLTTDHARIRMWQAGWRQFQLSPTTGTGSGTYLYYGRQFRHPAIQKDPVYAHNEFIQLLAEYGIIGIALAVIFIETHLRRGWNTLLARASHSNSTLTTDRNDLALIAGCLSALAAVLMHSFMEYNLHMPATALAVACVFGLIASVQPTGGEMPAEGEPKGDWPAILRLALPALGLWIGLQAVRTLPAEITLEKARLVLVDSKLITEPEAPTLLEQLAQEGIAQDRRNPELYFCLAQAHEARAFQANEANQKQGELEKTLAAYEQMLALAPRDVRTVLAKVRTLDALRRYDESAAALEEAAKLDPLSGEVSFLYGLHLEARGQLPEAAAKFQRAAQLGMGVAAVEAVNTILERIKGGSEPPPKR